MSRNRQGYARGVGVVLLAFLISRTLTSSAKSSKESGGLKKEKLEKLPRTWESVVQGDDEEIENALEPGSIPSIVFFGDSSAKRYPYDQDELESIADTFDEFRVIFVDIGDAESLAEDLGVDLELRENDWEKRRAAFLIMDGEVYSEDRKLPSEGLGFVIETKLIAKFFEQNEDFKALAGGSYVYPDVAKTLRVGMPAHVRGVLTQRGPDSLQLATSDRGSIPVSMYDDYEESPEYFIGQVCDVYGKIESQDGLRFVLAKSFRSVA